MAHLPTKTHLNAVTLHKSRAPAHGHPDPTTPAPGYVSTTSTTRRAPHPTREDAAVAIKYATIDDDDDGPTGGYFNDAGPIPS